MRVADPTLKAIQKQALLSYYERHAGRSSNASKSPPPPALPRTMASSTSPTHPAKVHNKSKIKKPPPFFNLNLTPHD
jgi:hypothetical protein